MTRRHALRAALPHTLPIFAGFTFLGAAYGIYMNSLGFAPIYPIVMSLLIFAGSMEFVAASLLLSTFQPFAAFALTLMVNARHLFYGISMLERYRHLGRKKWYMIFGLCDESFAINYTAEPPADVDRGQFMFWVTVLNQLYWVFGATIGSVFGSLVALPTKGLEFVMTALFLVIFIDQWRKEKQYTSGIIGIGASLLALALFGRDYFMLPAMALILIGLVTLRTRMVTT